MENKIKVLFVCVHNSARSQIAEAFLKNLGKEHFIVESAGLELGVLNPLAIDVMKEIGIDISQNKTKSVFDFIKMGKTYDYVITVCDETSGEKCPFFPGKSIRLHWYFGDPSSLTGTYEEKLNITRRIRDEIKKKIEEFIKVVNNSI